jgi:hypothetical protein
MTYEIEYVYPRSDAGRLSTDAAPDELADVVRELIADGAVILSMTPTEHTDGVS